MNFVAKDIPEMFKPSSSHKKISTCPICQDEKPDSKMKKSINCIHKVCDECFKGAKDSGAPISKCPLCRKNFSLINNEEIQPIRQQRVRRRLDFIEIDDEQPPPIPFMRAVDYDSIRINGHINNSFWELPESRRNIILEEQVRRGRNIRTIQDIQYSLYIPLSVNETMFLERCSSRKLQRLWRDYQQKRNIRNQRVRDDDNLWMLELSQIEKEFLGFN